MSFLTYSEQMTGTLYTRVSPSIRDAALTLSPMTVLVIRT